MTPRRVPFYQRRSMTGRLELVTVRPADPRQRVFTQVNKWETIDWPQYAEGEAVVFTCPDGLDARGFVWWYDPTVQLGESVQSEPLK